MAFEPQTKIIEEIGSWGKQAGKKIVEAFNYEGDWSVWAQVELALYFRDFGDVNALRNQNIDGMNVDLLLKLDGAKDVAICLICEKIPPGKGAKGDPEVWQRIRQVYTEMKDMPIDKFRPTAMGLMVSDIAYDSAKLNLCDKSLFDVMPLYTPKTGLKVNLFFRWI